MYKLYIFLIHPVTASLDWQGYVEISHLAVPPESAIDAA
jgi:hypothetical protein